MISLRKMFSHALLAASAVACATGGGDDGPGNSNRERLANDSGGGKSRGDDATFVSEKRATLVNSLSNNSMTSQTISIQKADNQAKQLSPNAKDKKTLEGRISALRLARKDLGSLLDTAKNLADLQMQKGGVNNNIDDDVKLELAISAVNNQKFALAEYYLIDLYTSKNPKVRAGAFNLTGVIALRNGRIPTAVVNFKEALKNISSYSPAQLNLGFLALRGGDAATAKRAFSSLQNDWFVQSGLVTLARLEGNRNRADTLCNKLESRNHKPTLFNCGLQEFQVNRNFNKAQQLMNRAVKVSGPNDWDKEIYQTLTKVKFAEAEANKKAAASKASKAAPPQNKK